MCKLPNVGHRGGNIREFTHWLEWQWNWKWISTYERLPEFYLSVFFRIFYRTLLCYIFAFCYYHLLFWRWRNDRRSERNCVHCDDHFFIFKTINGNNKTRRCNKARFCKIFWRKPTNKTPEVSHKYLFIFNFIVTQVNEWILWCCLLDVRH